MEVTLPKLGESILTAKVVQWFKKEGDHIELDEPLLEVSTDKVNSEIPSPFSGVLEKILVKDDEECAVGDVLCLIGSNDTAIVVKKEALPAVTSSAAPEEESELLSPAVIRMASEAHIGFEELKKIKGTGGGGRVTKKDLEHYLEKKRAKPCPLASQKCEGQTERVPMNAMRKAIAESMVRSFYQAPHASLVIEVDMTAVKKAIDREKEAFQERHGFKLTLTSFIAKALARSLQEYPYLNASLDNETILLKRFVNLGVAVSVERGIMVPVIKRCETLSVTQIAQELSQLAEKARLGSLRPDDVQGGTITMTNFGMSGVSIGIPIIHFPEVAIIGIGALQKKVVALEDDSIAVRSMMHISLTFDHRLIDGMYGCAFLSALKEHLEKETEID